ncbi:hypothetical protein FE391_24135 [Nonomuraea sp. KC401]|uniref:hypothetical protein n=1 Tax=unclassified Nonomuraea TaxID=2593643 RepID=UPI0010FEB70A|nr:MULTISPECIES: hypothetical protein [unclassified Nonomuraea]NBE96846.1 hypothetical protein [Nonomuraea sp. K271]TLF66488.1 hypothetical protein FE391_24135 [Nonomuraea sp. KC401]
MSLVEPAQVLQAEASRLLDQLDLRTAFPRWPTASRCLLWTSATDERLTDERFYAVPRVNDV